MGSHVSKNYPLVSVAIITYNQKQYLIECIESCLAQDYPNFEIVVADDGSTDGTKEILMGYSVKFPGKFVLRFATENRGITLNSNLAHFSCSGKYVAWLGGDDLMLDGRLAKQVEYLEENPKCSIVYSDSEVFNSETGEVIDLSSNLSPKVVGGGVVDMINLGCFVGGCTAMVRRDATPCYGFDVRMPIASDWKYWIDTLRYGGTVDYLEGLYSRHRRHDNNVTNKDKGDFKIGNYQDHLMTCEIVLTENPKLKRYVLNAESRIFRAMRFYEGGRYYRDYLALSMSRRFNLKAFVAYIVSFFSVFL